jgi:hypothetical protein
MPRGHVYPTFTRRGEIRVRARAAKKVQRQQRAQLAPLSAKSQTGLQTTFKPFPLPAPPSPADAHGGDKATAKLLGAALGSSSEGDVEMGARGAAGGDDGGQIAAAYAPRWVQVSENIRGEMVVLKERINKLKA